MVTYVKIKSINLHQLNNSEYLAFMNSILSLLPPPQEDMPEELSLDEEVSAGGSPAIGLSKAFVNTLETDVLALADVVNESRIAQETEEAQALENQRDIIATYGTTRISRSSSLPLEAERDAGKFLYKVVKPYIGIARLPVAQESVQIQGLLLDLRKEENAPYVTILGLESYLAELESVNNAYINITKQRIENQAANKKETGAAIRERINSYYEELVLLAQSYNVVQPTEASTSFVNNLNQLISATTAAYNQRKKGNTSSSGGNEDSEAPDEL